MSQINDPCGSWNTYRLTFTGDQFPAGVIIDYPSLGQDSRALLIGTCEAKDQELITAAAVMRRALRAAGAALRAGRGPGGR